MIEKEKLEAFTKKYFSETAPDGEKYWEQKKVTDWDDSVGFYYELTTGEGKEALGVNWDIEEVRNLMQLGETYALEVYNESIGCVIIAQWEVEVSFATVEEHIENVIALDKRAHKVAALKVIKE